MTGLVRGLNKMDRRKSTRAQKQEFGLTKQRTKEKRTWRGALRSMYIVRTSRDF